jgi:hypothetical protein
MVEDRADVIMRGTGRRVAKRGQCILDRMGPISDLGLSHNPCRSFESVHQAQQTLDGRFAWVASLQFKYALRALVQKFARFEAKISVGIRRHALDRHMRLDDAQ